VDGLREWFPVVSDTTPQSAFHPSVTLREPTAVRRARMLLAVSSAVISTLLVLGALGHLHPAGDSLSVLRPALAAGGLLIAGALLCLGSGRSALLALAAPGFALLSLAPHWYGGQAVEEGGLTLYQKNILFKIHDTTRIREDILRADPDIVTLEELHPNNERILDDLRDSYPSQIRCNVRPVAGSAAILSRYPFRDGSAGCSKTPGMARAVVETPDGPITIAAIHFEWPWPHRQPGQVEGLMDEIAALEGPVVLAGDFNMVRWSSTIRRIAEATGTEPVGRARVTFPMAPLPFAGVSIDHVLAPNGAGTTSLRPLLGSDHMGVLARVAMPVDGDVPAASDSAEEARPSAARRHRAGR
jgi:endonuclease/exonuclease/phosphatase (EEP) superfamily protein YafD